MDVRYAPKNSLLIPECTWKEEKTRQFNKENARRGNEMLNIKCMFFSLFSDELVLPWWLGSLEHVSNSSRHYLAIGGSNPGMGEYIRYF